jgi:hypothetical protein
MRHPVYALAFAASTITAAPAMAQGGHTLFSCTLGNGKTVSVTARGDSFTYRYGTPRRAELVLHAAPRSHTGFFLTQRYYAIATQVRFTSGDISYIVNSIPSSSVADAQGTSGVMVLRGRRVVADLTCRHLTELGDWEILGRLPRDSDDWDFMALER